MKNKGKVLEPKNRKKSRAQSKKHSRRIRFANNKKTRNRPNGNQPNSKINKSKRLYKATKKFVANHARTFAKSNLLFRGFRWLSRKARGK